MRQILRVLVLSTVILSSCDKEKDELPLVLNGEYNSGNTILAVNPVTMYTNKGIVKDQQTVNRFLLHRSWLKDYFSQTDAPIPNNNSCQLIFQSNKRVSIIFKSPTYVDTIKTQITSQITDRFILSNIDSVSIPSLSYNASDRCEQLSNQIKQEYPNKRCLNLSPVTGYSQFCKFRPIRIINITNENLSIPYFSWMIQSNTTYNRCSLAIGGEWNKFNLAITNQLNSGDTIVVQQREISLFKK